MMREETRKAIEIAKEKFGERAFGKDELKGLVSVQTLKKYDLVESTVIKDKKEVSLDELIKDANEMIGEDCYYGGDHDYYYERDGEKIYYVDEYYGYKFK